MAEQEKPAAADGRGDRSQDETAGVMGSIRAHHGDGVDPEIDLEEETETVDEATGSVPPLPVTPTSRYVIGAELGRVVGQGRLRLTSHEQAPRSQAWRNRRHSPQIPCDPRRPPATPLLNRGPGPPTRRSPCHAKTPFVALCWA